MWGSSANLNADARACITCPALADCQEAVRQLAPVRCEGCTDAAVTHTDRTRHPLRSRYAYALQPGQVFTIPELAARAHRTPASARAWLFDAAHAGIVEKLGTTGHNHVAIWRFAPQESPT
jgi:hypothetical protein